MKIISYGIIILMITLSCGCSSHVFLKPNGESAHIVLKSSTTIDGEILAIQDTAIYILTTESDLVKPRMVCARLENIQSVEIKNFYDKSWLFPLVALEGIPTILLTIAAANAGTNAGGIFAVFLIPTGVTFMVFEASTPSQPFFVLESAMMLKKDLRKYARFPQGLTSDQINQLLNAYKAESFTEMK